MQNNIKRDYFWNTLGVFAQNAISPLLLIAITRINGIYDSGVFSFAFSVSIIFWAFGIWGGRTYQVSDVKHKFSNRSYLMVRFVLAAFMILGAIIFLLINHYDLTKSALIITLVFFKVLESIADAIYGVLQIHGRLFVAGKSLLYKSLLSCVLFIITDIFTKSIILSCLAIVVVNALFLIFYDMHNASNLENMRIKREQMGGFISNAFVIIKCCLSVSVVIFLTMFSLNIPRYFIDMYYPEQIGYFGILAMPITLITLLMSFLLQPNIVNLSKYYDENRYHTFQITVKKLVLGTIIIGIFIFLAALIIGIPALELVFGISFDGYKNSLMVMIVGGIAGALVSVFINILVVMRHFKGQFCTLLLTNVVLALLSPIIIKEQGMIAGISLFAATDALQIILLIVIYRLILSKKMKLIKSDKVKIREVI